MPFANLPWHTPRRQSNGDRRGFPDAVSATATYVNCAFRAASIPVSNCPRVGVHMGVVIRQSQTLIVQRVEVRGL